MKVFLRSCFILSTIATFLSCNPDPVSPVIFVTPGTLHITINGGDLMEFEIEAFAGDNDLHRIEITQKPVNGVTSHVLDTTITGSASSFFWQYVAPSGVEELVLKFKVTDTEGLDGETGRRLFIEGNELLPEASGFQLFSPYSDGNSNAFNIDDSEPLFLSNNPEDEDVDLIELDDSDDGEQSLILTSYSGIKFVRNNSYNYPEATQQSAANTYTSSTPQQVISDIQVDDIIVTEYDTTAHMYAVIKITGVSNEDGSENDKYTFNLKK